jgi:hypothetical protein
MSSNTVKQNYVVYAWKNADDSFHRISYTGRTLRAKLNDDREKYEKVLKGKPLKTIYVEKVKSAKEAKRLSKFYRSAKGKIELINKLGKGKWLQT